MTSLTLISMHWNVEFVFTFEPTQDVLIGIVGQPSLILPPFILLFINHLHWNFHVSFYWVIFHLWKKIEAVDADVLTEGELMKGHSRKDEPGIESLPHLVT